MRFHSHQNCSHTCYLFLHWGKQNCAMLCEKPAKCISGKHRNMSVCLLEDHTDSNGPKLIANFEFSVCQRTKTYCKL